MNRNALSLLLIAILAFTPGCTARSVSQDQSPPEVAKLERGPVYLAPVNAEAAGQADWAKALEVIDTEISRYASSVSVAEDPAPLEQILKDAQLAGSQYAFVPNLEKMKMPAGKTTGRFNIEITINVYDLDRADQTAPVMNKKLRMKGVASSKHGRQPEYLFTHMVKQFAVSAY